LNTFGNIAVKSTGAFTREKLSGSADRMRARVGPVDGNAYSTAHNMGDVRCNFVTRRIPNLRLDSLASPRMGTPFEFRYAWPVIRASCSGDSLGRLSSPYGISRSVPPASSCCRVVCRRVSKKLMRNARFRNACTIHRGIDLPPAGSRGCMRADVLDSGA